MLKEVFFFKEKEKLVVEAGGGGGEVLPTADPHPQPGEGST